MFGFLSFPKILALAAAIGIVWYGYKLLDRYDQRRRAVSATANKRTKSASVAAEVENMVPCPVCGVYLSANQATACGKVDCPY